MNFPRLSFSLCLVLLMGSVPTWAQTTDDTDGETTAPPGSTVITADELHADQNTHVSVFTGNVITTGTNFRLTCQEMTVNFTKDNKVDTIVATGDVVITQPDRITHCGRAQYIHDTDTFILTDQPVILDHKNEVHGTRITIERTTQKMTVDGGRSTIILGPDSMSAPTPSPTSTDNK